MKNLDLKAYGVQEMNTAEMQEENGGNWVAILKSIAEAIITGELIDKGAESYKVLVEGYMEEAKKGTFTGIPHWK